MLAFLRWFCDPDRLEEIEGDLIESFHKYVEKKGIHKARYWFVKEVLLLFRPGIIRNISPLSIKKINDMKKLQWLQLIALNGVVILCMFLPFLPGPYDKLSYALSGIAQLTGFLGLLLVPVGAVWLIQEVRILAGHKIPFNNWTNGYYYSISAVIISIFISFVFVMMLLINVGSSAAVISLVVFGFIIYKFFLFMKRLRSRSDRSFNAMPLYLISLPLIAFAFRWFFMGPVSDHARSYAIRQAEKLIYAIESYYDQRGEYPESIENLVYHYHIPKPSVMGIDEFQYERNGNAYNLSFIQWQHFGATEEIVMYNKIDQHTVKGHFASYDARQPHWKYYWLD